MLMVDGPDIADRVALAERLEDHDVILAGSADHDRAVGGCEYHRYPLGRGVNPLSIARSYWRLRRIIRAVRPDIVQTFHTSPGIWGRVAAKHEGVPVIIGTMTGLGALYGRDAGDSAVRRVYERLLRYASAASSAVVFQNESDLDELVERRIVAQGKALLIRGSGVDVKRFRPAEPGEKQALRERYGLAGESFVFVMASRLLRSKGVEEYCRAAESLWEYACILLGATDSRNRDSLTDREIASLTRHVIWPGRVDNVAEMLRVADAFVLPTRYREGIPRAVLEAMATGLPVVTTPEGAGGMQPGVVIEGCDADAVRVGMEAMMRLSLESRATIGRWNREKAERQLSSDRVAWQYGDLYERLLTQPRTAVVSAPS